MEIQKRKEKGAMVVSVKGRLDATSSPEFEGMLAEVIAEGEHFLVVDFAELDYISSAGLRSILATTKKLKEREGRITLCGLKDMVKEVFEISGFSAIIPICDSRESALAR